LEKIKPADAYCLIGVLMTDLYPILSWNYVFGLAQMDSKIGVFSFARYRDSFY
jgi:archaemetzincin